MWWDGTEKDGATLGVVQSAPGGVAAVQVEDVGETVLPLSLDGVIVGQEGMHDKVPEKNNDLKV